ncbi:cadherin repeat domain-containing protein [Bizionia psychrotolerans]|uniref:cadherin repeat domain-containing protein n=1 Tax=Bizionia psychrotolerans TaxID=1492901 RepID=UPI000651D696|nr:cadherin repeat domain-containing protein [Bizionia psychrotolerans]
MNILKNLTVAVILLCLFNCSSDDDINDAQAPPATSFNRTINENPTEGLLIGTIPTTGASSTNFSITSQSINGALRIDPSTGNLIVNNALVFDFETNPSITAVVRDLNNNSTTNVTIDLTNIDDIAHFLSTSKADYLATPNNDWIVITEAEYELLAERLNQVSRLGSTVTDYLTAGASSIDNVTATNVGGSPNLPVDNYFFGFKYHSLSDNVVGARVKISVTDPLIGFIGWGRPLPEHDMGDNYFVLKNDNGVGSSNEAYIAVYSPGDIAYINSSADKTCYADNGDVTSFPAANISTEIIYLYQGLYTPQKQWGE